MPVTNAYTKSINRLAKDKNREGRGYTFEVMRAQMLYTTKHKRKAPTARVSSLYKKIQEEHRSESVNIVGT